jgi:hypothetical protein
MFAEMEMFEYYCENVTKIFDISRNFAFSRNLAFSRKMKKTFSFQPLEILPSLKSPMCVYQLVQAGRDVGWGGGSTQQTIFCLCIPKKDL